MCSAFARECRIQRQQEGRAYVSSLAAYPNAGSQVRDDVCDDDVLLTAKQQGADGYGARKAARIPLHALDTYGVAH